VSGVTSGTSGGTVGSYTNQGVGVTSATLSGLNSNAYYYVSIIPYNTAGASASAVSSYNGIYTRAVVSSVSYSPSIYSLNVNVSGTYAYFTWRNNSTGGSGTVNTVNGGSFTDNGLAASSNYSYTIVAVNSAGVSSSGYVTGNFTTNSASVQHSIIVNEGANVSLSGVISVDQALYIPYGTQTPTLANGGSDLTSYVRGYLSNGNLNFNVSNGIAGDPLPGVYKEMYLIYTATS
jgi:hypothetical protein